VLTYAEGTPNSSIGTQQEIMMQNTPFEDYEELLVHLPGDPDFESALVEVLNMHRRKGADYGTEDDFFANVSQSENWGIEPWVGAMLRLNDKVIRLQQAAQRGSLVNESVEDSMLDIATYAIIALCLFRRSVDTEQYYEI
jgi:hypothetical protein